MPGWRARSACLLDRRATPDFIDEPNHGCPSSGTMNERDIDVREGWPHRAWLASLIQHGVKLGLSNIRTLLRALDNPHHRLRCVHVAGTNGKGSTCAFIDAMLRAAGLRVGRYTSPHLHDVTERIQVNGQPIPESAFAEAMDRARRAASSLPHPPTFFEALTAAAFDWFAREEVDAVIIEVGLGGRFDATSVIENPAVAIITGIGLEHTHYLGTTHQAIAMEKAGILRPGVPALVGPCPPEAAAVIEARAETVRAPLLLADRDFLLEPRGDFWTPAVRARFRDREWLSPVLPLPGTHQARNAGLALVAVHHACQALGVPADMDTLVPALATARWPGRLEKVLNDPPVLLDAAHNPQGIQAILPALEEAIVLFAVASDKDAATMASLLSGKAAEVVITAFRGSRAMPVEQLARYCVRPPRAVIPSIPDALPVAIDLARQQGRRLVVLGSIYAVAEARALCLACGS
ncbi:MAG TPA: folylpolyglutamate synthase/dihydrofolate synthase family protein [Candidatus Hydrogenedentes bacterium]|nr:folylpolyglutamate synthase/dihydrofolate synthase family protein [Candidatus Hydrogenedentota bacterium]